MAGASPSLPTDNGWAAEGESGASRQRQKGDGEEMSLISRKQALICVGPWVVYPVAAYLVWAYAAGGEDYGVMAALLAANAAAALATGIIFGSPGVSGFVSRELKYAVSVIAAACGLASAGYWMAEEVNSRWILVGSLAPIVVTLVLIILFLERAIQENAGNEGGDQPLPPGEK